MWADLGSSESGGTFNNWRVSTKGTFDVAAIFKYKQGANGGSTSNMYCYMWTQFYMAKPDGSIDADAVWKMNDPNTGTVIPKSDTWSGWVHDLPFGSIYVTDYVRTATRTVTATSDHGGLSTGNGFNANVDGTQATLSDIPNGGGYSAVVPPLNEGTFKNLGWKQTNGQDIPSGPLYVDLNIAPTFASKSFEAIFDKGSPLEDDSSGRPIQKKSDCNGRIVKLLDDSDNPQTSWTLPLGSEHYYYPGHRFSGWQATVNNKVFRYTDVTDSGVAADLTDLFVALAVGAEQGTGATVPFTPIWTADNFKVYLCDDEVANPLTGAALQLEDGSMFTAATDADREAAGDDVKYVKTYTYGDAFSLPSPDGADGTKIAYREGYVFGGWTAKVGSTVNDAPVAAPAEGTAAPLYGAISDTDFGDYVLYAKLTSKSYTITYDYKDDSKVTLNPAYTNDKATYTYSEIKAAPAPTLASVSTQATPPYGYTFKGWTVVEGVKKGTLPAADGMNTHVMPGNGAIDAAVLAEVWPADGVKVNAQPGEKTLHAVWASVQAQPISLDVDEPASIASGEGTLDGKHVSADGVTSSLYLWYDHGLTAWQDNLVDPYEAADGTKHGNPSYKDANSALAFDGSATSDSPVTLKAPSREGYTFVGWGRTGAGDEYKSAYEAALGTKTGLAGDYVLEHPVAEGAGAGAGVYSVVYAAFTPSELTEPGQQTGTFTLTDAGAALVSELLNGDTIDADWDGKSWDAIWRVNSYDVALRVPKSAVAATTLSTKWAPADDAASGWYSYEKTYSYYDGIEVPTYSEVKSTFTFEGWYRAQIGGEMEATGSGDASGAGYVKGTTTEKFSVKDDKGAATEVTRTWGELRDKSGNKPYRVTKDAPRDSEGNYNIWLRYRGVQIGVDAPVDVAFLCAGPDEAAYDVGVDGRELLESPISFTTSGNTSHELYVAQVDVETGEADKLYANELLERNDTYSKDNRFFWLSRDPTVEYYLAEGDNWYMSKDLDVGDKRRIYFGTGEGGDKDTTVKADGEGGDKRLTGLVLGKPAAAADDPEAPGYDPYNNTFSVDVKDESGTVTDSTLYRKTTFWYGLDLRRCHIDKAAVRKLTVDDSTAVNPATNTAYKAGDVFEPKLAKLTFTFEAKAAGAPAPAPAN